jgi:hypothetical protein
MTLFAGQPSPDNLVILSGPSPEGHTNKRPRSDTLSDLEGHPNKRPHRSADISGNGKSYW